MQTLVKKTLDFLGLNMWHVVIMITVTLFMSWLLWDNHNMANKIESQQKEISRVVADLDRSLEINKNLNNQVVLLQVGKVIDEQIVADNQAEIDKIRKENEKRVEQVNRQAPTGPAAPAIVCAITRVCD